MAAQDSSVLRVALALSMFDFVQMSTAREISMVHSPLLLWLTVLFTPVAFYWLLCLPTVLLPSAKLQKVYALLLFGGRMALCAFMYTHWALLADAWPRLSIGLLIAGVFAFAPSAYWDRIARQYMNIAVVPGVVFLLAFLFVDGKPQRSAVTTAVAAENAPNLVLITWDTVRADVLSEYGGTGLSMPNLAAFAADSMLFEDACASTPITAPSHATMLTGVLPPSHGVRSNVFDAMAPGTLTLPTILAENGYRTGGFVAAYPLLGRFGFQNGFEIYDDRLEEVRLMRLRQLDYFDALWMLCFRPFIPAGPVAASPGEVVQKRVFDWLEEVPTTQPIFLFEHLYDAHAPNNPSEPRRSKALAAIGTATPPAFASFDNENMALYRAQIERLDELLGEMLAQLERRDPGLRNTLIVLTADHGDCFGEGGYSNNHIASLYEATQHVPMLVRLPGAKGAGTRVPQTVTHYDLMPTFLAQAGIPLPPSVEYMHGVVLQLAATPEGLSSTARAVYLEAMSSNIRGERKRGWRTPEWKFLLWEDGHTNLWSYRQQESVDFVEQEPARKKKMQADLLEYFESLPKGSGERGEISSLDLEALKALGYAD
jgi:arylsulfatase A-like enzyme